MSLLTAVKQASLKDLRISLIKVTKSILYHPDSFYTYQEATES